MTIRLLLALTALIAVTILMLRLFWFGNGVPGATLPAFMVGEAIWIGSATVCFVVRSEDHQTRAQISADVLFGAVLSGTVLLQIALPLKMLREFSLSIAG